MTIFEYACIAGFKFEYFIKSIIYMAKCMHACLLRVEFLVCRPFSRQSSLAHRNRSFFCDLAIYAICDLRFAICDAHRGPQRSKSQRFLTQEKAMLHVLRFIRVHACGGQSLAICDFGLRFLSQNSPLLSAGFLAIWLTQCGIKC